METLALGAGGPQVRAIGFGAQMLSILGRPSEEVAIRVLHGAFDAGATLIDTADVYSLDGSDIGYGERLVARALRSWPGDRSAIVVATKGGSTHPAERVWRPDGRPEHLRRACEASLRALGVERIDLYQLHSVDPKVPYAEALGALVELQAQGKIRWIGVSNVARAHVDLARRLARVQSVQNPLSPYARGAIRARFPGRNLVHHCARHGIAFIAYSPFGGPGLSERLSGHPLLRRIAARHGVSPHAAVLAWVRAQGPNVVPIVSARSVEHARDSLAAVRVRLTPLERLRLGRASFPAE